MALVFSEMDKGKLFEHSLCSFWAEIESHFTFTLKVKWSYISAKKLKSERSNIFPLSISLKTKAFTS